jgi:hypothetical protein
MVALQHISNSRLVNAGDGEISHDTIEHLGDLGPELLLLSNTHFLHTYTYTYECVV